MNELLGTFISLDQNILELFNIFDSKKEYENQDHKTLKHRINQLNDYHYFKLIEHIVNSKNLTVNLELLNLFLEVKEIKSPTFNFNIDHNQNWKKEKVYYLNYNQKLINLINEYKSTHLNNFLSLDFESNILSLLNLLKDIYTILNSKESILDSFYNSYYHEKDFLKSIKLSFEFKEFQELINYFNEDLHKTIEQIEERVSNKILEYKELNYNYLNNDLEHKFTTLAIIIYKPDEWEEFVLKKLNNCKNECEFKKVQSFFQQCIKNLQSASHSTQAINYTEEGFNSIIVFKDLKKWLDSKYFSKPGNYKITADDVVLKKLYNELERGYYINVNKTSLDDFIKVLKLDWNSHNSKIYLEMDHLQTKLLLDRIKMDLKIRISYANLERAGNILNNNGPIKASSLSSSNSKSYSPPKKEESLINLVKKVKI